MRGSCDQSAAKEATDDWITPDRQVINGVMERRNGRAVKVGHTVSFVVQKKGSQKVGHGGYRSHSGIETL